VGGGEGEPPAAPRANKAPKVRNRERHAYKPDLIHMLIHAQPALNDRIALMLLAWLGFRKNELRLLQLCDFNLYEGTVLVHGKGGKQVILPLGFAQLKSDLELHLVARDLNEYLLYPRARTLEPMDSSSVHRWSKRCLEQAGLPATVNPAPALGRRQPVAADRGPALVQQLLRHEASRRQLYVHPSRDDLDSAAGASRSRAFGRGRLCVTIGVRSPQRTITSGLVRSKAQRDRPTSTLLVVRRTC
jgi:integrase